MAAARQRLRPILMTSLAFVFGVLPLAVATGAGAGGRTAIGTGVAGGMLSATSWRSSSCRCSSCGCARTWRPKMRSATGAPKGHPPGTLVPTPEAPP